MVVSCLNSQWDGDLASMENVAKYNKGIKYLLVLIDIFSRLLLIRPLKDKNRASIRAALKIIFKDNKRRPNTIRFDQGGEFKSEVRKYLTKEGVHVFYTQNS